MINKDRSNWHEGKMHTVSGLQQLADQLILWGITVDGNRSKSTPAICSVTNDITCAYCSIPRNGDYYIPSRLTNSQFLEDPEAMLTELSMLIGRLLIVGDFNLHFDDLNDKHVRSFRDLLEAVGVMPRIVLVSIYRSNCTLVNLS